MNQPTVSRFHLLMDALVLGEWTLIGVMSEKSHQAILDSLVDSCNKQCVTSASVDGEKATLRICQCVPKYSKLFTIYGRTDLVNIDHLLKGRFTLLLFDEV